MYNGIGLTTPRGSGTSGHVVKNASALRPGQETRSLQRQRDRDRAPKAKAVDQGIVEHNRRRQVEVKCLELQDELEAQGCAEDEVETRVDTLRKQLLQNLDRLDLSGGRKIRRFETQRVAEAKDRENQRLASALRVEEGYAEGAAFDRELQELRREKRLLERERQALKDRERRSHRHSRSRSKSPQSDSYSDRGSRSRSRHRRRRHRRHSPSRSRSRSRDRSSKDRRADPDGSKSPDSDSGVRQVEDGEPGEIEELAANAKTGGEPEDGQTN
ncbi:RNA-splicing factor [Coemansia spiralis]|nr:RNA-splicing factor [Coemansia spiralis]